MLSFLLVVSYLFFHFICGFTFNLSADGTAKGKRGAKAASSAPADATAGGGISAVSSESWAARIVASGVEECVSSDEEDAYERVIAEQASGNAFAAMPSGVYRHEYSLVGAGVMGEAPEPLWPPQLLVARRRPTVSAVNSANASATGTNSVTGTGSSSANVSFSVSGALAAAAGVVLQDDTAAVEGRVAGAASNVATAP